VERKEIFLIACYVASVGVFVSLLFQARTPIPTVIWDTFSPSNLIVYLAMTFLLVVLVMRKGNTQTKLSLIILHSVVSVLFKQIVCESRYGYDTWVSLGYSKLVFSGEYPKTAVFTVYSPLPLLSKIYHVTERVNLYSLGVLSARMFSVDIYWTHLLLSPILWGVFMPVLVYGITKFLSDKEAVPLLSALLSLSVPTLVSWASGTTSQSLAWVLCAVVVYLSLRYLSSGKGLLLALVVAFATFITHELVGVLSFSMVLLADVCQITRRLKQKYTRRVFLLGTFILIILLLPLLLQVLRLAIGGGATFSLEPLEGLSAYDAVFMFLFGGYAEMSFSDFFVQAIVLFMGLIGLIYVVLERGERSQGRKASVFMLLCLILVMIDYRIVRLFMAKVPFSPERMWVLTNMLTIPFAAVAIVKAMGYLSTRLASTMSVKLSGGAESLGNIASPNTHSINFGQILAVAIVILSISSLITSAVYNAYAHSTYMRAWTTAHEIDAARYIEETTPRNETYAVLCEATTRLAGYAVVGPQNPRAYYYGAYESRLLTPLYNEMVRDPSLGPVLEAQSKNNASIVYVMVSTFRPPVDGNPGVIEQMMDLPFFELHGVFGEGVYIRGNFEASVYVFRVRPPRERIIRGTGPLVYVYNNQTFVNTTFTLDIVTYQANLTAIVAGLPSYNITGWPTHWSFESITPSPIGKYVDANKWINFTSSETETYSVKWTANMLYQPVGWKDDSFKEGWRVTRSIHWEEEPQTSTDGDVLTMTGLFQEGIREGLVLEREVANVSTDEYPYVVVRWRSTGTCASVLVTYDGNLTNVLKPELEWTVPVYGQYSDEWKVSIAKLAAGKAITSVRLYLDDYPSWTDLDGTHSVYYDYIMLANLTTPEL
jgi:hypothetical protein